MLQTESRSYCKMGRHSLQMQSSSQLGFRRPGQPSSPVRLLTCLHCQCLTTASEKTMEELGIGRHPPLKEIYEWTHYKTLSSPPADHPQGDRWASSIYRGLVPAKNITKRDFAINGAVVSRTFLTRMSAPFSWILVWHISNSLQRTMGMDTR